MIMLPSGKHTKHYGKSPCLMGKSTIKYMYVNDIYDMYVYIELQPVTTFIS